MCTNQDISSITFIMRGNHLLVHGHKKGVTSYYMHFSSFTICSQHFLVSAILHHNSLLRLLTKSYFKRSTLQPSFLCSSSFKGFVSQCDYYLHHSFVTKITAKLKFREINFFMYVTSVCW